MTIFVEAGLGKALVALLLALVALFVGLVCRRPVVAHAFWLLVLLELVTPPLMSVSLPWPAETTPIYDESSASVTLELVPVARFTEPLFAGEDELPVKETVEAIELPALAASTGLSWQAGFGLVWIAGSLLWFTLAARRLGRFGRLLHHASPASAVLSERVADLARQLGLRRPPRILLVQGHLSPMVWALGRVTLLVPAKLVDRLPPAALDTLLAHELAHIRRRDHWVRWLELLCLGLYWWNPVVWLARRELRQAEELCCDAWVVRCLPDARRVYATALVDALDFLSRPDESVPALGCGLGRVDDLKWRLTMILRGQTSPRLGWTTTLGVLGLALLLLPLVPSLSPADDRPESTAAPAPKLENLDPKVKAMLQAEVEALVRKRLEEIRARAGQANQERTVRTQKGAIAEKTLEELRALEAEIESKTAQLRVLKARASQAMENPRGGYGFRVGESPAKPGAGVTLHIEIHGSKGNPEEIKRLTEQIRKLLEGKGTIVMLEGAARRGHGFMLLEQPKGIGQPPATPNRAANNEPNPPTALRFTLPVEPNRRIDALEKKLDIVLRELEALRQSKAEPRKSELRKDAPETRKRAPGAPNPPSDPAREPSPAR